MNSNLPSNRPTPSVPKLRARSEVALEEAGREKRALKIDEALRPVGRLGLWLAHHINEFYVELFGRRWGGTRLAKLVLLLLPLYLAYIARAALQEKLALAVPIVFTLLLIVSAFVFRALALKYASIGAWLEKAETRALSSQIDAASDAVRRLQSTHIRADRKALKAATVRLEQLVQQAREAQLEAVELDEA